MGVSYSVKDKRYERRVEKGECGEKETDGIEGGRSENRVR